MRQRAAVIILREDAILLMYRRREGREYYVVPGGSVEAGESPAAAAIREAKEETGYDVVIDREAFTETNEYAEHHYFLVHPVEGEAVLGGEELEFHSEEDFYRLDWVPFANLPDIPLVTPVTKKLLLDLLLPGFIKVP